MTGPLESTKYFILLALAEGPQYGTAIRGQLVADTVGTYLRDSTLYSALKSLVRDRYIEELGGGGYRRTYQLTEHGSRTLELEARTHKRAAQLAFQRLRIH